MAYWHKLTDELQLWFTTSKTHPAIACCILTTLHDHGTIPFSNNPQVACHQVAYKQDQIGFYGILFGHLSTQWGLLQESYGLQQGHASSAQHWTWGLCLQLLHLSHAM